MNRRDFMQAAALGAAAGTVAPLAASAAGTGGQPSTVPTSGGGGFPRDFWWGAATAAYQVEGAAKEDGRGPSIWDTFSHLPGKVVRGETGDVACDHYHRYRDDVALLVALGVKHYRFSISWSRVLPAGRGTVNPKGLDFYRRLVDELLAHGITPHATLYHWDLPQALQDRHAGWQSRAIVQDFADYASLMAKHLGDRVHHWMTLNEIATFVHWCGYGIKSAGEHAPGVALSRPRERWQVNHHALLAHGAACQALRAASPGRCSVALAENYESFVPIIETPEHIAAARHAFTRTEVNGAIITPLLTGRYDPHWLEERGAEAPEIRSGDMALIAQPLDALGFNCYTGNYVRAAGTPQGYEVIPWGDAYPKLNMPWLAFVPEAIYWGVRLLGEALGRPDLPIFISENGCADGVAATPDGTVLDIDRLVYLRAYLRQVQRAIAEGRPVVGYFPWSLLDNFEWACGYDKRFGLVHVDYRTQKRTPKLSYQWYQQVIRQNRVV